MHFDYSFEAFKSFIQYTYFDFDKSTRANHIFLLINKYHFTIQYALIN